MNSVLKNVSLQTIMNARRLLLCWATSFACVSSQAEDKTLMSTPDKDAVTGRLPAVPPTPANEAVKKFKVIDGFHMDLLAAEPLVASPVAMTHT